MQYGFYFVVIIFWKYNKGYTTKPKHFFFEIEDYQ